MIKQQFWTTLILKSLNGIESKRILETNSVPTRMGSLSRIASLENLCASRIIYFETSLFLSSCPKLEAALCLFLILPVAEPVAAFTKEDKNARKQSLGRA